MRNFNSKFFGLVLLLALGMTMAMHQTAPAQIITFVIRGGTSTNDPPVIAPNSLAEDELSFVDRAHQYNSIPIGLLGAEYVMVANNDKTQADYSLDVELMDSARLYLFLDNRLGHGVTPGGDPNLNPDLWSAGMNWVYSLGFADTGLNIGIDEGGDGQINQWASVYVKNVQPGLITLDQQNDSTEPADRNMYGVTALKRKLFRAFWFDNGKLNLAQTPDWVVVRSGYYAGWDWFDDGGYWRQPFEDPPPGGPNLWAFTDHLTFLYTVPRVYPIHRWFFFWDPSGQGNCLELIAEDGGSGCPDRPVDPDITINLNIQNHAFSVNADKVLGEFGGLELVPINMLEAICRDDLGMPEDAIQTFMDGDIISQLQITDPLGNGPVGVQHAHWTLPSPQIMCPERLEITEGETISYPVRLREQPDGPVTVNVKSADPATIKWADYDEDVYQLHFAPDNWDQPQVISIAAKYFMDIWDGSTEFGRLAHYMAGGTAEAAVLPVMLFDKKTSGKGYLDADINRDAITNFKDVAIVAAKWLESTESPEVIGWEGPWQNLDIGTTGGSASYDPQTETWTVKAQGNNIWGNADQFHFVHHIERTLDHMISATVLSLEDTHEWAKAGLMVRKTLDPDSPHATIVVTPHRGVAFQWRPEAGAETQSVHFGPAAHLKVPISLRLVQSHDTVTGYYYSDGTWVQHGSAILEDHLDGVKHMGMAVTSHVEGTMTTATFGRDLVGSLPLPLP
jgi:hypothetical protein